MFVYAVSPRPRFAVKSQNLPSNQHHHEGTGTVKPFRNILQCVSRINPMWFASFSVASALTGSPETKQKPNVSWAGVNTRKA